jgi:hypothetical protein
MVSVDQHAADQHANALPDAPLDAPAKRRGAANLLTRMSLGCTVGALSIVVMVIAAVVNAKIGRPVGVEWVSC